MSANKPIVYSICIPYVFNHIPPSCIRTIFHKLGLGTVEQVDMVPKKDHKTTQDIFQVFVHFSSWNKSSDPTTARLHTLLEAGEKVKVVYNNPWFWMVSKSTSKLPPGSFVAGDSQPSQTPTDFKIKEHDWPVIGRGKQCWERCPPRPMLPVWRDAVVNPRQISRVWDPPPHKPPPTVQKSAPSEMEASLFYGWLGLAEYLEKKSPSSSLPHGAEGGIC